MDTEALKPFYVPLVSLVVGWLLKDVLLGFYRQRREDVRREHLFRLREFYSPLFFWSGVGAWNHNRNSSEMCIQHLGDLLEKAAPLVKHEYFVVFIRLYEYLSGQKVTAPNSKELSKARSWVYTQIELLNFALFTNSDDYDVRTELNPMLPLKRLVRFGITGLIQFLVWAMFAALTYCLITVGLSNYWAMAFSVMLVGALITGEFQRRVVLVREMNKRMNN